MGRVMAMQDNRETFPLKSHAHVCVLQNLLCIQVEIIPKHQYCGIMAKRLFIHQDLFRRNFDPVTQFP